MNIATGFFYLFSAMMIGAAFMVISARNPVHSVLFLILAFFNAAGLFVLLGAEFLAMILVVVYVGAVAVLFLFVVMMLDVDFAELKQGFLQYLPVGGTHWPRSAGRDRVCRRRLDDRARRNCQCHDADAARYDEYHGARTGAVHPICLSIRGSGSYLVYRYDRRHRADLAPQGRREAAERGDPKCPDTGRGSRGPQGCLEAGEYKTGHGKFARTRRGEKPS